MSAHAPSESRPSLSVLLTTQFLDGRTGSEIVLRDRALALARRGHRPIVFSLRLGAIADELRGAGVPVTDDLRAIDRPVDLIHASHRTTLAAAIARFPQAPAISAHQDFVFELDRPWPFASVRRWLACDQTVADGLISQGVPADQVAVLLNGVDLERFREGPSLPERPTRALALCKNGQHMDAVAAACAGSGIGCDFIGPSAGAVVAEVEDLLPRYDLVFASALSALEAMACGRAVIVCDGRGLAGFCDRALWAAGRPLNFGLRTLTRRPTEAELTAEIARYDPAEAAAASALCRAEASLERHVDALLDHYRDVLALHAAEPTAPDAVARDLAGYLQAWGGQMELRRARSVLDAAVPLARDTAVDEGKATPLRASIDSIDHAPLQPINLVDRTEAAVVHGWTLTETAGPGAPGMRRLLLVQGVDDPAQRYVAVLGRAIPRPDLAVAFPQLDPRLCQMAGFNETIDFTAVAPGRYRMGLACRRGGHIEARMFDRLVEVI
jgi:hypothetical protein